MVASLVERLEGADGLDAVATPVAGALADVVGRGPARWWLGGGWLGHAAHPLFTDLPIGFWTSANVLDLAGGRRAQAAAQRLVALGVLSAVPTALTGLSDWSASGDQRVRRVGLVHALGNTTALVAYTLSWRARHRQRHVRGVAWGLAGAAVATGAGYLGGHLSYGLGSRAGEGDPGEISHELKEEAMSEQGGAGGVTVPQGEEIPDAHFRALADDEDSEVGTGEDSGSVSGESAGGA